ncbi:MAG TPA: hypothetical protein VMV10_31990 [Pirellulales bacterium]|nr:hypothetical protein [Pirellulales bacterium]
MSAINGVGAALASYSTSLTSPFSSTSAASDASQVQPGSPLSPDQIAQLRLKLQQAVDQAFAQGKSPVEINKLLQKKVSDALAKFGVSESDRSSTMSQLSQLFNVQASDDQLRQQAQDLLQGLVDNLAGASPGPSPSGDVGQNVDLFG